MKRFVFAVAVLAASAALAQIVVVRSGRTMNMLDVVTNGVDAGAGGLTNGLMCMGTDGTLAQSFSVDTSGRQNVNVAKINAITPLMGNGVTGTGSQRVTVASDNTPFPVKLDQTTPGTTNGCSISHIAATAVASGNGVVGAGVQRVAIASDNTAFSVNATCSQGTAASLKSEVVGNKTTNVAAPGATNIGVLGAVANAAAQGLTETYLAAQSVDLFGQARVLPGPMNLDMTVVADYTNCAAAGCVQDDGGTPIAAGAYFVTVADETATICHAATCATGGRTFPIGRYVIRLPAATNVSGRSTSSTADIQYTKLTQ